MSCELALSFITIGPMNCLAKRPVVKLLQYSCAQSKQTDVSHNDIGFANQLTGPALKMPARYSAVLAASPLGGPYHGPSLYNCHGLLLLTTLFFFPFSFDRFFE
jgi:hypothetical protein